MSCTFIEQKPQTEIPSEACVAKEFPLDLCVAICGKEFTKSIYIPLSIWP